MPKLKNGEVLTATERQVLGVYLKTRNKAETGRQVLKVTNSTAKASSLVGEILARPRVKQELSTIMEEAGLSREAMVDALKKTLTSSLSKRSLKKSVPADGIRVVEMGMKLLDQFPVERKQIDTRNVSVVLQGHSSDQLAQTLDSLIGEIQQIKKLVHEDNNPIT